MVMDGGSVVAQQATAAMSAQQQQPAQGQAQQQQGSQTGAGPDTAPNATRVAREFVRQYYTILHESPGLLHRCVLMQLFDHI